MTSQFRTAFYSYYPEYGKFLTLEHTCADGSMLCQDASYEGSLFSNLSLQKPLPPGVPRDKQEASRLGPPRPQCAEARSCVGGQVGAAVHEFRRL